MHAALGDEMTIRHNTFPENPGCESLGAVVNGTQKFTVGLFVRGKYDFGIAQRTETITILTQTEVKINGVLVFQGQPHTIPKGQQILIEVFDKHAAYLCTFNEDDA